MIIMSVVNIFILLLKGVKWRCASVNHTGRRRAAERLHVPTLSGCVLLVVFTNQHPHTSMQACTQRGISIHSWTRTLEMCSPLSCRTEVGQLEVFTGCSECGSPPWLINSSPQSPTRSRSAVEPSARAALGLTLALVWPVAKEISLLFGSSTPCRSVVKGLLASSLCYRICWKFTVFAPFLPSTLRPCGREHILSLQLVMNSSLPLLRWRSINLDHWVSVLVIKGVGNLHLLR